MIDKSKRIFFLGMHVVLTKTELPRLRQLGYEVFNPPYLTDIYDQSANTHWDTDQPSTLPREIFETLARTNFFYNRISPEAASILNEYFGTVIVTINRDWLHEVLKVYQGRIIYRCYGQPWTISEVLTACGVVEDIQNRDNFHVVPHAAETTYEEHDWFQRRMRIVPYMLPWDIFDHRDTWESSERDPKREVMVNIPNIRNLYYANQYDHMKAHFGWDYYRIYGVQPNKVEDPQVVGTLSRSDFIGSYKRCCGMLYPYHDERVCYLPPLEMMMIGGPVVYVRNSLLYRFFETAAGVEGRVSSDSSPGLAGDLDDQRRRVEWLRQGDQKYIKDVIASQEPVRLRYAPEHVWPIFDRTFRELIDGPVEAVKPTILFGSPKKFEPVTVDGEPTKRVYVLFHFPGHICQFKAGKYFSFEGIPRVVQKFVQALLLETDHEIVMTCYADHVFTVEGFFNAGQSDGRIKMMVIDHERLRRGGAGQFKSTCRVISYKVRYVLRDVRLARRAMIEASRTFLHVIRSMWPRTLRCPSVLKPILQAISWLIIQVFVGLDRAWDVVVMENRPYLFMRKAMKKIRLFAYRRLHNEKLIKNGVVRKLVLWYNTRRSMELRREAMDRINEDPHASFVLIPHYYLFSEAIKLDKPTVMYLPDYTPHFFPGVSFDPRKDKRNNNTGRKLADRATAVFTNSEFSKGYLPDTVLQVPREKITCIPIPLLVGRHVEPDREEKLKLNVKLGGKRFVFYPTANRPNKQIAFLLEVFSELLTTDPDLHLVLTCGLDDFPAARKAYERLDAISLRAQKKLASHGRVHVQNVSDVCNTKETRDAEHLDDARVTSMSDPLGVVLTGTTGDPGGESRGNPGKNQRENPGENSGGAFAIPRFSDRIVIMQGATDAEIQWLYEQAVMMLFTSTMEGNFPPQVFESITYGTPVVATRLPLITEVLKEESDRLLLCEPLDLAEYVRKARYALEHAEDIREQQRIVYKMLLRHSSDERFNHSVGQFLVDKQLS